MSKENGKKPGGKIRWFLIAVVVLGVLGAWAGFSLISDDTDGSQGDTGEEQCVSSKETMSEPPTKGCLQEITDRFNGSDGLRESLLPEELFQADGMLSIDTESGENTSGDDDTGYTWYYGCMVHGSDVETSKRCKIGLYNNGDGWFVFGLEVDGESRHIDGVIPGPTD